MSKWQTTLWCGSRRKRRQDSRRFLSVRFGVYALIVMWSATIEFSSFQVAAQPGSTSGVEELTEEAADAQSEVDELVAEVREAERAPRSDTEER